MTNNEEKPSYLEGSWAFGLAMAKFAFSGFATASKQERLERLQICQVCPLRSGRRCLKCGCFIGPKAHVQVSECPYKMWRMDLIRKKVRENVEFTRSMLFEAIAGTRLHGVLTKKSVPTPKLEVIVNPKSFRDVPCRARVNGVCCHRTCELFRQKVEPSDCGKCPMRQE